MSVVLSSRLDAVTAELRAAGCVFAEDEAELLVSTARTMDHLTAMVDRRVAGLPLEHVVGWAEFCGRRITVEPGVFVPRRRTEFLVEQAMTVARPHAVVLDLCCGSGAIGAALAAAVDGIELHATDIEPTAVRCARRNLVDAGARVYEGDLFEPLPSSLRQRVDLLVAVTPYVPSKAIRLLPPEARLHEPRVALDGGADGLDVLRRMVAAAPAWLAPGGSLITETSADQASRAAAAMTGSGSTARVVTSRDDRGSTVVIGTVP